MSRLTFLITIITFTLSGVVLAAEVKSQDLRSIKVRIDKSSTVLKHILADLEKQSGFSFAFSQQIGEISAIALSGKTSTLYEVLKEIAQQKRLKFNQENYLIAVTSLPPVPKPSKMGKISGKILDDKGLPLPGASIRVVETGQVVQSATDGSYSISLPPGTYILEVSYISFQTQKVTSITVSEDGNTPLSISMKTDSKGLKQVVITTDYKKASTAGLLAKQKNASEMSNGISAEQIARTPDKNIGESLKRISGVSTIDNKFVLVRGIGERYNSAMLDGVTLPSTEAQSRNFSFDMIPSNMVENVVVSKTVTPDMNASFGGGLIQINTRDIPNENFMGFTAGASYNDQTTGKDFLSHKRGKYDYMGFDDGRRNFPEGLVPTIGANREVIDAQSKRFINNNFTLYKYRAAPSQNYQFSIGRLFAMDTVGKNKFGFTGSLSYRNTQSNNIIDQQTRGSWYPLTTNKGNAFGFNTTLGGLLNLGLQLDKNRFSLRNTYTHLYDNTLVRISGYTIDAPNFDTAPPNRIKEADDPTYTNLLQNKLSGQHQLGRTKIDWNLARTSVDREEKDLGIAESGPVLLGNEYKYFYGAGQSTDPGIDPTSRHHYQNKEQHYSWDIAASIPFTFGKLRNNLKGGYFGNHKKAGFNWQIAPFTTSSSAAFDQSLGYLPFEEKLKPENMGLNGFQYGISPWYIDNYAGKSQSQAGFLMLDNRLMDKLRLVWGLRGEYYKYTEISNPSSIKGNAPYFVKPDPRWQWLPSANLTYSPISSLNIRAAYSSSVVRPELMDNSRFFRYSPYLEAQYGNQGLYSTRIDSWDFKTEWFPDLGEILSVGAFYKKFDKPAELVILETSGGFAYYLKSSNAAKVYGMEFELRKNFGFISDNRILNNLTVYGNITLQKSEVTSFYAVRNPAGGPDLEGISKQNRAMYGQAPYLVNAGIQYTGDRFGLNLIYNKSGRKTYLVAETYDYVEFEQPRDQVDAQLSYRFHKKRLELKLNAGNLFNKSSLIYRNIGSYERNPDYSPTSGDISEARILKPGFSNKYEEGDQIMFSQKFGRTYSTSLTYTF